MGNTSPAPLHTTYGSLLWRESVRSGPIHCGKHMLTVSSLTCKHYKAVACGKKTQTNNVRASLCATAPHTAALHVATLLPLCRPWRKTDLAIYACIERGRLFGCGAFTVRGRRNSFESYTIQMPWAWSNSPRDPWSTHVHYVWYPQIPIRHPQDQISAQYLRCVPPDRDWRFFNPHDRALLFATRLDKSTLCPPVVLFLFLVFISRFFRSLTFSFIFSHSFLLGSSFYLFSLGVIVGCLPLKEPT